MKPYRIPARRIRTEIRVVNSRFIATAQPAFSVEEAKAFIQEMKHEFADATHNVPAFLIGYGASVTAHSSDDGEPSGTAGRPALAVLQGSGLGDIVVVVTRYFGGTKLGTGGLVRAYSDAVKAVLAILPLAEKVATDTLRLVVPYGLFEQTRLLIQKYKGLSLQEDFGAAVTISVQLMEERVAAFNEEMRELSRGTIQAEVIASNPETILPLEDRDQ